MGDEKKRRPGMGYGVSPDAYNAYGSVISELAAKKQTAKPASASVETGVQQQQATTEQADSAVQNFANLPLGKKLETLKNSRKGCVSCSVWGRPIRSALMKWCGQPKLC